MIMTGAAAGLAAAFNTPLGGIVFAVEELTRTRLPRCTKPELLHFWRGAYRSYCYRAFWQSHVYGYTASL
jgi:H+/Cl- antiporter ClcA